MIKFLLKELEKSPHPVFSKNELLAVSQKSFRQLFDKKILSYHRPTNPDLEQIRHRCQHGCPLSATKVKGELEGLCLEHSEETPIPIMRDDLCRYTFSIEGLLHQVRTKNRIEGNAQKLNDDITYIGYKTYDDYRIAFVFATISSDIVRLSLAGLSSLSNDDDFLIVFTPVAAIEDILLKSDLRNDKMIQVSLSESLNPETFELSLESLISEVLGRAGATEITDIQLHDYDQFEYKCHDKIHIPGTIPLKSSNALKINENKLKIGNVLFVLFLRLVEELKKENGGWVSLYDLEPLGIIIDPGNYQVYSRLRTELKGSLIEKNAVKFIENDGHGQYRISTHPGFITYNRDKLRNHTESHIREIAERLPMR